MITLAIWAALSVPAAFATGRLIDRAERNKQRDLTAAMRRHPAGKAPGL